jgi:hypothetical protein
MSKTLYVVRSFIEIHRNDWDFDNYWRTQVAPKVPGLPADFETFLAGMDWNETEEADDAAEAGDYTKPGYGAAQARRQVKREAVGRILGYLEQNMFSNLKKLTGGRPTLKRPAATSVTHTYEFEEEDGDGEGDEDGEGGMGDDDQGYGLDSRTGSRPLKPSTSKAIGGSNGLSLQGPRNISAKGTLNGKLSRNGSRDTSPMTPKVSGSGRYANVESRYKNSIPSRGPSIDNGKASLAGKTSGAGQTPKNSFQPFTKEGKETINRQIDKIKQASIAHGPKYGSKGRQRPRNISGEAAFSDAEGDDDYNNRNPSQGGADKGSITQGMRTSKPGKKITIVNEFSDADSDKHGAKTPGKGSVDQTRGKGTIGSAAGVGKTSVGGPADGRSGANGGKASDAVAPKGPIGQPNKPSVGGRKGTSGKQIQIAFESEDGSNGSRSPSPPEKAGGPQGKPAGVPHRADSKPSDYIDIKDNDSKSNNAKQKPDGRTPSTGGHPPRPSDPTTLTTSSDLPAFTSFNKGKPDPQAGPARTTDLATSQPLASSNNNPIGNSKAPSKMDGSITLGELSDSRKKDPFATSELNHSGSKNPKKISIPGEAADMNPDVHEPSSEGQGVIPYDSKNSLKHSISPGILGSTIADDPPKPNDDPADGLQSSIEASSSKAPIEKDMKSFHPDNGLGSSKLPINSNTNTNNPDAKTSLTGSMGPIPPKASSKLPPLKPDPRGKTGLGSGRVIRDSQANPPTRSVSPQDSSSKTKGLPPSLQKAYEDMSHKNLDNVIDQVSQKSLSKSPQRNDPNGSDKLASQRSGLSPNLPPGSSTSDRVNNMVDGQNTKSKDKSKKKDEKEAGRNLGSLIGKALNSVAKEPEGDDGDNYSEKYAPKPFPPVQPSNAGGSVDKSQDHPFDQADPNEGGQWPPSDPTLDDPSDPKGGEPLGDSNMSFGQKGQPARDGSNRSNQLNASQAKPGLTDNQLNKDRLSDGVGSLRKPTGSQNDAPSRGEPAEGRPSNRSNQMTDLGNVDPIQEERGAPQEGKRPSDFQDFQAERDGRPAPQIKTVPVDKRVPPQLRAANQRAAQENIDEILAKNSKKLGEPTLQDQVDKHPKKGKKKPTDFDALFTPDKPSEPVSKSSSSSPYNDNNTPRDPKPLFEQIYEKVDDLDKANELTQEFKEKVLKPQAKDNLDKIVADVVKHETKKHNTDAQNDEIKSENFYKSNTFDPQPLGEPIPEDDGGQPESGEDRPGQDDGQVAGGDDYPVDGDDRPGDADQLPLDGAGEPTEEYPEDGAGVPEGGNEKPLVEGKRPSDFQDFQAERDGRPAANIKTVPAERRIPPQLRAANQQAAKDNLEEVINKNSKKLGEPTLQDQVDKHPKKGKKKPTDFDALFTPQQSPQNNSPSKPSARSSQPEDPKPLFEQIYEKVDDLDKANELTQEFKEKVLKPQAKDNLDKIVADVVKHETKKHNTDAENEAIKNENANKKESLVPKPMPDLNRIDSILEKIRSPSPSLTKNDRLSQGGPSAAKPRESDARPESPRPILKTPKDDKMGENQDKKVKFDIPKSDDKSPSQDPNAGRPSTGADQSASGQRPSATGDDPNRPKSTSEPYEMRPKQSSLATRDTNTDNDMGQLSVETLENSLTNLELLDTRTVSQSIGKRQPSNPQPYRPSNAFKRADPIEQPEPESDPILQEPQPDKEPELASSRLKEEAQYDNVDINTEINSLSDSLFQMNKPAPLPRVPSPGGSPRLSQPKKVDTTPFAVPDPEAPPRKSSIKLGGSPRPSVTDQRPPATPDPISIVDLNPNTNDPNYDNLDINTNPNSLGPSTYSSKQSTTVPGNYIPEDRRISSALIQSQKPVGSDGQSGNPQPGVPDDKDPIKTSVYYSTPTNDNRPSPQGTTNPNQDSRYPAADHNSGQAPRDLLESKPNPGPRTNSVSPDRRSTPTASLDGQGTGQPLDGQPPLRRISEVNPALLAEELTASRRSTAPAFPDPQRNSMAGSKINPALSQAFSGVRMEPGDLRSSMWKADQKETGTEVDTHANSIESIQKLVDQQAKSKPQGSPLNNDSTGRPSFGGGEPAGRPSVGDGQPTGRPSVGNGQPGTRPSLTPNDPQAADGGPGGDKSKSGPQAAPQTPPKQPAVIPADPPRSLLNSRMFRDDNYMDMNMSTHENSLRDLELSALEMSKTLPNHGLPHKPEPAVHSPKSNPLSNRSVGVETPTQTDALQPKSRPQLTPSQVNLASSRVKDEEPYDDLDIKTDLNSLRSMEFWKSNRGIPQVTAPKLQPARQSTNAKPAAPGWVDIPVDEPRGDGVSPPPSIGRIDVPKSGSQSPKSHMSGANTPPKDRLQGQGSNARPPNFQNSQMQLDKGIQDVDIETHINSMDSINPMQIDGLTGSRLCGAKTGLNKPPAKAEPAPANNAGLPSGQNIGTSPQGSTDGGSGRRVQGVSNGKPSQKDLVADPNDFKNSQPDLDRAIENVDIETHFNSLGTNQPAGSDSLAGSRAPGARNSLAKGKTPSGTDLTKGQNPAGGASPRGSLTGAGRQNSEALPQPKPLETSLVADRNIFKSSQLELDRTIQDVDIETHVNSMGTIRAMGGDSLGGSRAPGMNASGHPDFPKNNGQSHIQNQPAGPSPQKGLIADPKVFKNSQVELDRTVQDVDIETHYNSLDTLRAAGGDSRLAAAGARAGDPSMNTSNFDSFKKSPVADAGANTLPEKQSLSRQLKADDLFLRNSQPELDEAIGGLDIETRINSMQSIRAISDLGLHPQGRPVANPRAAPKQPGVPSDVSAKSIDVGTEAQDLSKSSRRLLNPDRVALLNSQVEMEGAFVGLDIQTHMNSMESIRLIQTDGQGQSQHQGASQDFGRSKAEDLARSKPGPILPPTPNQDSFVSGGAQRLQVDRLPRQLPGQARLWRRSYHQELHPLQGRQRGWPPVQRVRQLRDADRRRRRDRVQVERGGQRLPGPRCPIFQPRRQNVVQKQLIFGPKC